MLPLALPHDRLLREFKEVSRGIASALSGCIEESLDGHLAALPPWSCHLHFGCVSVVVLCAGDAFSCFRR